MFSLLNLQSLFGLVVIIAACWALSENKRAFPWKLSLGAVAVQAGLVLALFAIPGSQNVLAPRGHCQDHHFPLAHFDPKPL